MKNKHSIWTSANIVTIIRILLVPLFVVALLSPWPTWIDASGNLDFIKPWVALVIFVILSATDSVDGYLARSRNEVTNFGKFMDPLADKILVFAALIALVELSVLPSWVVLVILIREFIVSGARMLAASKGMVIAASWYGKAKTVTQIIAIVLFILKIAVADSTGILNIVAWLVMAIALILTVVSMFDYLYKCKDVFSDENDEETVIELAKDKKLSIATAESLTGGLLCARLVNVSGASEVVLGGINSYAYSIKSKILGIDKKLLKEKGAVNHDVAKFMAQGVREKLGADIAVSTTGIAGPSSDEFDNPVGLVYIGISTKDSLKSYEYNFKGTRDEIRNQAVDACVSLLKKVLNN